MESSREACHGLPLGEEFQDEEGLELSLGLSLSSGDSRQKSKASEGASARSSPLIDLAGEPSAAAALNGFHPLSKPKPPNKTSGLDAALKKFLEGRLDEQEESVKLLDGSNSFSLPNEKDKSSPVGSQEQPSQQLDQAFDAANKGNPFLFKELQGSSGLAASMSQSPAHTTALQLVDAFKNTSSAGSPHFAEGAGHFEGDDAIQDNSGQQKFQDAGKKRKHLVEELNHQKKGKKEDTLHGFCRPGSNTWMSASPVDKQKSPSLGLKGDDGSEQVQLGNSQEKQDSAEAEMRLQGKGYESDGDESTGCEKTVNADLGQNDTKGTSGESKGAEVNFMPQLKFPETVQKRVIRAEDDNTWHLTLMKSNTTMSKLQEREISLKGLSTSPKNGQAMAGGREVDTAGSPLQRIREKVSSETSSISTGGTEKIEEKSRGGEASSSVPEVLAGDRASPSASMLATSFCPPGSTTNSAPVSYPVSPYPVAPISYSIPASAPHSHGMPFPVGMNFPYMMQYVPPPGAESSEQNIRPAGNTAFQAAGFEYPPPQLSPLEGASWMQALRPPVVSPFSNPSNGALYSRNTLGLMPEDAKVRLPVSRMHDNGVGKASPAADTCSVQNHLLFRTAVASGAHDQGPEAPVMSSLPLPAVPHFTSQLGISDHGEHRSSKEQNAMNAFPGFAASAQAAQVHALSGLGRPPSSSSTREEGQEQAKFGGGRSSSSAMQQHVHNRNITEPGQEDFGRVMESQFHQGSTENISVLDGLGEDVAFLQYGIAPGLKFGGTGTAPDLPWVHATGPNGQTIGGVLYRLSRTQLRVVCACHGKHMSPVEFAQHASSADTDKNVVVNSPLTTHAA
ncbi:hypothetical protein GOP47_0013300 [Adiantum capillus-veneris]|uniref:Tify domain-containing protein n=1 Tax=Adiantum capillus-veneris TaxID=13818 RepID=A0A9D4ZDA7_ADICA|nr:hypothetical protein GOP47_0013300 [Adiantum capillus-veneris]